TGIRGSADYCHQNGLRFWAYDELRIGTMGCGVGLASGPMWMTDAQAVADAGVDGVKLEQYPRTYNPGGSILIKLYIAGLNSRGKNIFVENLNYFEALNDVESWLGGFNYDRAGDTSGYTVFVNNLDYIRQYLNRFTRPGFYFNLQQCAVGDYTNE